MIIVERMLMNPMSMSNGTTMTTKTITTAAIVIMISMRTTSMRAMNITINTLNCTKLSTITIDPPHTINDITVMTTSKKRTFEAIISTLLIEMLMIGVKRISRLIRMKMSSTQIRQKISERSTADTLPIQDMAINLTMIITTAVTTKKHPAGIITTVITSMTMSVLLLTSGWMTKIVMADAITADIMIASITQRRKKSSNLKITGRIRARCTTVMTTVKIDVIRDRESWMSQRMLLI